MKTDSEREAQLRLRSAELDARMQGIEKEFLSHQSKDWEEMATERESDEVLDAMGEADKQEMRMIGAALDRIAAGEYGFCTKCGVRISEERLDLLPHTPFCRNCA